MSLSLGEKLRQAREEKGFTLSEVAEQTRISSLYLESIENDDYRILPGGIFNKGFVKSYAKHVGINEQEALMDYSRLLAESEGSASEEVKTYRPEVLTDDRSSGSMVPTVIMAVVILGLMTAGILFLLNYLRQPTDVPATNAGVKTNSNTPAETSVPGETAATKPPELANSKIEFSATGEPVSLVATTDGKSSNTSVAAGSTVEFTPKESLKLAYYRTLAPFVKLVLNGKEITLPSAPLNPKRSVIEFEINNENLERIWTAGSIVTDIAPSGANTNAAMPAPTQAPSTSSTPVTRPTVQTAPVNRPVANTSTPPKAPRPAASVKPTVAPPANR
jgi:cytoskeleton protein RodZ